MNRHSIFFIVTLSFVISLILVAISYFLLIKEVDKRDNYEFMRRHQPLIRLLYKQNNLKDISSTVTYYGYEVVNDKKTVHTIIQPHNLKHLHRNSNKRKWAFQIYHFQGVDYLFIKNLLLKDSFVQQNTFKRYVNMVFLVIFSVLTLFFGTTLKKLYPIKVLQNNIKAFGDENFDTLPPKTNKQDEVSLLANEFIKSAKKLKKIKEARVIFFRNIMHELKTPITKGKFLLELDNTQENKNQLHSIFNRLDALINEFASIELVTSQIKELEKGNYYITDIVENVQDMLLLDENHLSTKIKNQKIYVNFKFFSIALKNLVDNALKYSFEQQVTIYNQNKNIIVENRGDKLPKALEEYREPYGGIDKKNKSSFGLGLYITHHILEANDYILEYKHIKGINSFTCKKISK